MANDDLFGGLPQTTPRPQGTGKPKATGRAKFSWFFALRPSVEDAQRIYARAESLLQSRGVTGTRITPDRLHITLEWIGDDIAEDVIERAGRAADALRFPVLEARFDAIKTFPAPSGPCVLLGGEGLDEVRVLRSELVAAMKGQGLKAPRAYEPHMTLCYDRVHRLARFTVEPIGFPALEFALVKSHLGQSRHEVMRTWPLVT